MRRTATIIAALAAVLLGVTPVAASSGELVITSSTTLTSDHDGNVVIAASGITLDCAGHAISGNGAADTVGIRADNVTDVTIKDCIVTGFNPHGIYASGSSRLRLQGNTVLASADHAVYLADSPGAMIVGNALRDAGAYAVVLQRSSGAVIKHNTATDNVWAGFALVDGSSQATVSWNTSARNGDGFHVEPAADLIFSGNIARDNDNYGFVINGVTGGRFVANTVARNGADGFNIQASGGLEVEANIVKANGNGFYIEATTGIRLIANIASDNRALGFWISSGSDRATLRLNVATNNVDNGIRIYHAADARVLNNVAIGNPVGFDFGTATNATVKGNVARANTWAGFYLVEGTTGGTFAENVANRNASFGFVVDDGPSGNTLADNTAYGNGEIDALQTDDAGPNSWLHNHFGTQVGF
jgi:parallel beta-helix repeat protein